MNPITWYYKKIGTLNFNSYQWGLRNKDKIRYFYDEMIIVFSSMLDLTATIILLGLVFINIFIWKISFFNKITITLLLLHIVFIMYDYSIKRIKYVFNKVRKK